MSKICRTRAHIRPPQLVIFFCYFMWYFYSFCATENETKLLFEKSNIWNPRVEHIQKGWGMMLLVLVTGKFYETQPASKKALILSTNSEAQKQL